MNPDLRVAIVHYHLGGGGVTRVIARLADFLARRGIRGVLLSGAPAPAPLALPVVAVEGLGYRRSADGLSADTLAGRLRSAAARSLGGRPDLWHFHNHSLGKNPVLPAAVAQLAHAGERLLLQIHDFAEDGRPENYALLRASLGCELGSCVYPQGGNVHYAALNLRDLGLLRAAGIDPARTHHVPNALAPELACAGEGTPLLLWPSRPIRRKNLGELLLLAQVAPPGVRFATCLPPADPDSAARVAGWKLWARRQRLSMEWEVTDGSPESFCDWCARAGGVLTTSVAEGFGLSFIEPWVQGRPILGRDLPEITGEFGLDLKHLYARFECPADLLADGELKQAITSALERNHAAYGVPVPADAPERAERAIRVGDTVDFGRLDETLQGRILERVASSPELVADLRRQFPAAPSPGVAAANALRVRERFGSDRAFEPVRHAWRAVVESAPGPARPADAAVFLEAFLAPERLNLLRA